MSNYETSFARPTSSATSYATSELPLDLPIVLTRQDLCATQDAYAELLRSARAYRTQMTMLAQTAADFGNALENMARNKGALDYGSGLHAAAGFHFLISNHYQILSDAFNQYFETPLTERFEIYKTEVKQNQNNYDKTMREMSEKIKKTEAKNFKSGRKKQRDLVQFRRALQELTQQVDELEQFKHDHYFQVLSIEQKNFDMILSKTAAIIRGEVDIYERIANKGLADQQLEMMITTGFNPFNTYQTSDEYHQIFSVLPPVPILSNPPAESSQAQHKYRNPIGGLVDLEESSSDIHFHHQHQRNLSTDATQRSPRVESKRKCDQEPLETRSDEFDLFQAQKSRISTGPSLQQFSVDKEEQSQPALPSSHPKDSAIEAVTQRSPKQSNQSNCSLGMESESKEQDEDEPVSSISHIHIGDDSELLRNQEFNYSFQRETSQDINEIDKQDLANMQ
ncbi:uncharacterized protein VTP21DRAFT_8367 [Calcarisporiella thermophila]|uniref:uncharacterized protein n=1 Tax=Calcarisporiella thermophila TaxID=911321 RepID=UPI0037444FE7